MVDREIERKEQELWSEIYNKMIAEGEPKELAEQMANRAASAFIFFVSTREHKTFNRRSTLIN